MHGARQGQQVRQRRARPGNRAGRGPALAPDPKAVLRPDGRSLRPQVAHIVPNARSETTNKTTLMYTQNTKDWVL